METNANLLMEIESSMKRVNLFTRSISPKTVIPLKKNYTAHMDLDAYLNMITENLMQLRLLSIKLYYRTLNIL